MGNWPSLAKCYRYSDRPGNGRWQYHTHTCIAPTWHFVTPNDARWMIELTAPRINAFSASMFRQLQLDSVVFKRSNDALAKALEGNKQLNRSEVMSVLNEAGVATDDLRFIHLLMRAELD